jgi:hypothetical protein
MMRAQNAPATLCNETNANETYSKEAREKTNHTIDDKPIPSYCYPSPSFSWLFENLKNPEGPPEHVSNFYQDAKQHCDCKNDTKHFERCELCMGESQLVKHGSGHETVASASALDFSRTLT